MPQLDIPQIVYNVHAYRWGDRERHSYLVGVYSTKERAIEEAEIEANFRGGKYECEIIATELDTPAVNTVVKSIDITRNTVKIEK